MRENVTDQAAAARLAEVAPILRGLLADPTGDADRPFSRVVLNIVTSKEARDYVGSDKRADAGACPVPLSDDRPLLHLESPGSAGPEDLRRRFRDAIDQYVAAHGAKPRAAGVGGVGILCAERGEPSAATPLQNEVALVTGAAGAIGAGICRALLANGCRVAATDIPGEKLDDFVNDFRQTWPDRIIAAALDVTDEASVAGGFGAAAARWGGLDIVIVNAGVAIVSKLEQMDAAAFRRVQEVNSTGAMLTLRQAGIHFRAQNTGGDIVLISTKNVFCPGAGFGAYSATKAASHQLGRIASLELADCGVRVNMVAPDAVFAEGRYKSGLWAEVGPGRMLARGLDEKGLEEYYRNRNLLKAKVTAAHVANAVLFFVTRQTPTTGATIPVDGGLPDSTPR